jgi:hypothetical protein
MTLQALPQSLPSSRRAGVPPSPRATPAPARTIVLGLDHRRVLFSSESAAPLLEALSFVYGDFAHAALDGCVGGTALDALCRVEHGRTGTAHDRARPPRTVLRVGMRAVWRGRGDAEALAALDACAAGHLLPGAAHGAAVLHASCVEMPGVGSILLCAPSGGGKTTLAAALLAQGCRLVADDLVPLDAATLGPRAFPRALALKPGAPPPACALDDRLTMAGEAAPLTYLVAANRLRPAAAALPLRAVVMVNHAACSAPVLLPLPGADVAALLTHRVVEAPVSSAALAEDIAQTTPALLLQYPDAAAAAQLLLRALA